MIAARRQWRGDVKTAGWMAAALIPFAVFGLSVAHAADGDPTPAPAAASASAGTAPGAQPAKNFICFSSSIRCFAVAQKSGTQSRNGMDLRAPKIDRIFSPAVLREKIVEPPHVRDYQETVEVEGTRRLAPTSVGIMAIPWAFRNPTQAWRIFAPLPAEDAK